MSFVDRFLSHYGGHKDFSKASKFEAIIYPNLFLVENYGARISDLRLQCENAELPGYSFDTVDGRIYGVSYAVAARPTFSDLRLTFICAGDLWEKKLFDKWQEFIMPKTEFLPRYRDEYITTIKVVQYLEVTSGDVTTQTPDGDIANRNLMADVSYQAVFYEAFPTSVEPITLSWGDDNINRLTVNFKYRNWNSY